MRDPARGYWRLLLASAALSWLALAAANYVVDPYDVLGSHWLARMSEPQERYLKVRFLAAHPAYDSFLLGNSRVGTIRAEDVERAFPDAHAYNFTASQANGWDAEAIGAWLIRTRHGLRRLIVQADYPEAAGPTKPGFALLTAPPPQITGESELAFRARYLVTFSGRAFVEKIRVNREREAPLAYSLETGSWSRPALDRAIEGGCSPPLLREASFRRKPRAAPSSAARRAVIDADLASLARLARRARAAHVETIFFVPPRHHLALDTFDVGDYVYFLAGLARIAPYTNFGFYSPLTTDDCQYYEPSHYRPKVGAQIVRTLAARPAESRDARHVDARNVESELAFVRANFAAFRAGR